eukprot:XP_011679025.1 PREDICTED: tudor domain-containing protein 15 isoform X3 [Strongylocentrotus purpuratus]
MSRQRGAKLLEVGDRREVFVTAFEVDKQENAFRFWGQFDNESVERLETLMQEAQVHAEQDVFPPVGSLSAGDTCLAKFMEDGQWYRARVESVTGNDVIAYFIDFGNTEIIPRVRVRTVQKTKSVFDLPPQATNCKLANVEPMLEHSSLKAGTYDYIRKQLEYQTFAAEVIAKIGGNLEVKLCDIGSGKDVAQNIIRDGFGQAATGEASPSKKNGFKTMGLDVGSRDRVFVSNVNTPNQFWIQQEMMTKDLDELMNDMLTHYSQAPNSTSKKRRFSKGDPCVTTFSDDGSYYRAVITNTMGPNNYEVFFIDYGNSDIKRGEDLLEVHPKFLLLPAVAIESCLSDVDPDSCNSDATAGRFEELVVEKTVCCKVTKRIGDKCSLLMVDPTGGENADIANALVKEGLAGRPSQGSSPQAKQSPHQGYSARNIPARAGDAGESPARELDFNLPKFKKPQIRVGDQLDVQITFVKSGADFSCHLMKDADKFDPMIDNLHQAYSNISPGDQGIRQVAGGLPCCVQFSEDNAWYRAEVTYVRGQDVEVRYVDYGNCETVTPAQLKNLKPQFFSLPIQSILCNLDGISHTKASKSTEVKDFMDSTVAELDLVATIVGEQRGTYTIKLTDRSSGDNINSMVANMLQDSSPRGSPRAEMLKEYKTQTLREGEELPVFIGHVDDQGKCYVQKSSTVGELEALMEHMSQQFANFGSSIPKLTIGMSCGAQYSADQAWYRAKITGIRKNGDVEVTFVDYGNSEMVNPGQIKMLSPDMLELPAQAIACLLIGLPAGQQTSEEVAKLQGYIESECTLEVKGKDRISGVYNVRLISDGKCINDQFRQPVQQRRQDQNERIVKSPPRSDGYSSERSRPERERYGSHAKSPPQNDRFGQHIGKGSRFNSDGSGDAPDNSRFSKPRGDRASVSSNVSDRSNKSGGRSSRSDDSRGKGSGRRSDAVSSPTNKEPAVPLQFKEVTFPSKGTVDVFLSHINSPSEFWCQTAESTPQLHRVMSELHARYSSLRPNDKRLSNTTVGTPCVAKFSDDQCWYRAVVVNKYVRKIEVMFVDYGNSEKMALGNLKEILPDLVKLPVLAVKCSLQGDQEWQSAQIDAMKEVANQVGPFNCEVKTADCGVYEVELKWKGKRMTQELNKIKLPAPPVVPPSRKEMTAVAAPVLQVQEAPTTTRSTPVLSVKIPSEQKSLVVDQIEDVVISYWEGPFKFWCQLAKKSPELDAVMDGLANAESQKKVDPSAVREGLVCCAKFADDGAWYRARITKVIPAGSPEVLFIDYGNQSSVPVDDLRVLASNLTVLPAQAMQCNLYGLSPAQALSTPAVEKFTELTSEKQLVAKVFKNDVSTLTVTLHDTNTEDDIDITEEIKKDVGDVKEPSSYPLSEVSTSTETVYVTNIDANSGKVFLELASCTEELDSITSTLQSVYGSCSPTEHQLLQPVPSQACCTKFSEDEQWYRGVITATTSSTASVLFIDYGNSEEKPINELKQPTEDLLKVPQIALECCLDGVQLLPWTQGAADHFLNITAEKEVSCTFSSTTHPCSVSLKDDAVDINAEMVKFTGAGTIAQPTEYPLPSVSAGAHLGYVVNVDAGSGKVYVQRSSATEQLDSVTAMLEATYGSCGSDFQLAAPVVKQACCTRFSEDGQWYRGSITTISDKSAHVFFVDYGNSEEKPVSELMTPTPELLKIPQIALECSLDGVPKSPWQQDAADHLINASAEKELTCSFVSTTSPFVVHLKDNDVDLNADIVKLVKGVESKVSDPVVSYASPQLASGVQAGYAVNVDATTGKIFIQLASATEQLDTITTLLESTYSSCSESEHQLQQLSGDQACCTKFTEDEQWYRGIVMTTTSSTANVFFIDYGNSEEKQFSDLKAPTAELLKLPQAAIECRLIGLAEVPWQQDAVDHFLNITSEKELTCSFDATKKPVLVKLKDGEKDINTDMMALVGEKPKESPEEVKEYKSLSTSLQEQKRAEIYITATTSPSEFWIQPLAGEEALAILMDELNTYAENPDTTALVNPTVGAPCVAKYSSDEGWYRAIVTSLEKDSATVQFVDYGNSDSVGLVDLKVITPELMVLESQVIRGSLAGVGPVDGGQWSGSAAEFLETAVADKLLLMVVVGESNGTLAVKLMDMGMNIGDVMVDKGHAVSTAERVRQFPSVTSIASTASSSGEALEQASLELVEQVLSASLHELGLDVSEDGMDLAEADMDTGLPVVVEEKQETEAIAHMVLENLLAEITGNISLNLLGVQVDQEVSSADKEQKEGETEDDGVEEDQEAEGEEPSQGVKSEEDVFDGNKEIEEMPEEQKAEEDIMMEEDKTEHAALVGQKETDEAPEGTDDHQEVESLQPSETNPQEEVAVAEDVQEDVQGMAGEMPEDDTPEDETPVDAVPEDVVAEGEARDEPKQQAEGETENLGDGVTEDVPEADAAVQEDESLKSDKAFQSDEDCFKDAVAAEADQHKVKRGACRPM